MSKRNDIDVLKQIFLVCPVTGEAQTIIDLVDGPNLIIKTAGKTTAWQHKIDTEEIPPPKPEVGRAD